MKSLVVCKPLWEYMIFCDLRFLFQASSLFCLYQCNCQGSYGFLWVLSFSNLDVWYISCLAWRMQVSHEHVSTLSFRECSLSLSKDWKNCDRTAVVSTAWDGTPSCPDAACSGHLLAPSLPCWICGTIPSSCCSKGGSAGQARLSRDRTPKHPRSRVGCVGRCDSGLCATQLCGHWFGPSWLSSSEAWIHAGHWCSQCSN